MSVMAAKYNLTINPVGRRVMAPGGAHCRCVDRINYARGIEQARNALDLQPAGRDVAKDSVKNDRVPSLIVTLSNRGFLHCMAVNGRSMAGNLKPPACIGKGRRPANRLRDSARAGAGRCPVLVRVRGVIAGAAREQVAIRRQVRSSIAPDGEAATPQRKELRKYADKSRRHVVAPSPHRGRMAEKACYVDI
jgi:hypothetical protein